MLCCLPRTRPQTSEEILRWKSQLRLSAKVSKLIHSYLFVVVTFSSFLLVSDVSFFNFFSDILFTFLRCVPSSSSFCIASQSFGNDLSFHNVSLPACTSPKWLTLLLFFVIQFLIQLTFSVKTFPKIVLLLLND